jgi:hypothetical protein
VHWAVGNNEDKDNSTSRFSGHPSTLTVIRQRVLFDYQRKVLTFYRPGSTPPVPPHAQLEHLLMNGGHAHIKLQVDGATGGVTPTRYAPEQSVYEGEWIRRSTKKPQLPVIERPSPQERAFLLDV